jgi:acyl carrier protein
MYASVQVWNDGDEERTRAMTTYDNYDNVQEKNENTEEKSETGGSTPRIDSFDAVADIIAKTCDIPRDKITRESHAINDLGIDSLDFLDVVYAIDKAFGIKLPLEQWTQEVNDGKATTEQYFVLDNLCARIGDLVVAKGA